MGGCTAFAVDLLGHGESDRPFDAPFGIASQAEYLDRALTALRVARATVVGVDLGGTVALRLAATRPDRVDRLVVVNPRLFESVPGADIRAMQRNTARFALRISRGVLGAAALLAPLLEGGVSDPARMPPRLVARYLAPFVGREGVGHLLALARAIREEDVESIRLAAIRAPTLVVWGAADRWLDERIPKRLVEAIPRSRLLTLPEVGRLVPEESPAQLSSLLLDLSATEPPPTRHDVPAEAPPR
jgi:pimeloyl-ACP methyl ester carboxylesterase